jgi:O-acetyl-ADP-ribose deacetylase (regulator of RNase III)
MARARDINASSLAFPALGTGVGGFPLDEAARITVDTVRDELPASPSIQHVIFALRGVAAYHAFEAALAPVPAAPAAGATEPGS